MHARLAVLALLALLLTGCTAPPPPAPAPPVAPSPPSSGDNTATDGTPPEALVNGENAHVRVTLVDHRVNGGEVALTLDVRNKDPDGFKVFGYAILAHASGDSYLDMPGRLDAGQVARFTPSGTDDPAELRSAWANLTLYYQEHAPGAEYTDDEAVVLDLAGRGLPTNVA